MKAKKVLFITTEMTPFVPDTYRSLKARNLSQTVQEYGYEVRTFSPKWGIINERRYQLHEVIRLSGMNIIIDDTDHPLLIKVASIAGTRMQVYFIDNDEFFLRREMLTDPDGNEYADNGERSIFYVRGVLETLKKLRWIPDVIHCHGWATSLVPLFIKKAYQNEPSFCDAKVVFSMSAPEFKQDYGKKFLDIIPFRDIKPRDYNDICTDHCTADDLTKIAAKWSDGVVCEDADVSADVIEYVKSIGKPMLEHQDENNFAEAYSEFYDSLL